MVNPIREVPMTQLIAYNANNQPLYIGKAAPGSPTTTAVWQIQRLTYSGNNTTAIEWADGNGDFDNIWDNRASLNYS